MISFKPNGKIYALSDAAKFVSDSVDNTCLIGNSKSTYYYNVPCAFDIETTSLYYLNGVQTSYSELSAANIDPNAAEKVAIMYVWQLGINGNIIVGRTWEQFISVCNMISETLRLSDKKRLIIYVHNLSFEFQFIKNLFEWKQVFATDIRKPIYAVTVTFIEFRCSYLLSGYSLETVGKNLVRYKVAKLVGALDYDKPRHEKTPLTQEELNYCINDIRVVMSYIRECIENDRGIQNIPLTKTGYVRKYCRKHTLYTILDNKRKLNYNYINAVQNLKISGLFEFNMLQRAFQGGFTHANAYFVNQTLQNVSSYDFTSSYPYVMLSEQYPMSSGVYMVVTNEKEFRNLLDKYCCVFDIEFTDIKAVITCDNPISAYKCYIRENVVINNGRIVAATRIATTITDVDFKVIENFYTWKKMRIGNMYCYKRGYLPKGFINAILKLYADKTTLKGIDGKEVEYLGAKGMLNSCYGMCVTNPLRDEFTYKTDWKTHELTEQEKLEMLDKYNTSKQRFLFYPWGIFVTAYARRNLFTAIDVLRDNYVYSDTDSVKILNGDKCKDYFDKYNALVVRKLQKMCDFHGIDFDLCQPKNQKGVAKLIGIWDFEGVYERFKTLGAKRYLTEKGGVISLTVSGLNKNVAVPYLIEKYGAENVFDIFDNNLHIKGGGTGKLLHTYIDVEKHGVCLDYLGNSCNFAASSGVHLQPCDYSLNLTQDFINYYLHGIKNQAWHE